MGKDLLVEFRKIVRTLASAKVLFIVAKRKPRRYFGGADVAFRKLSAFWSTKSLQWRLRQSRLPIAKIR